MTEYRAKVTGESSYEIIVGRALLDEIVASFPKTTKKLCLIHQAALTHTAEVLVEALKSSGFEVIQATVPDGEEAKRIEVAAWIWGLLGKSEFSRIDGIIGLGGGAATDLAGFVASTWLRGISVTLIPTTLLGMVDAAIGGKTGINTAEGKNLVGSFYAPRAVFCDLDTLITLPRNELLAGFGEIVKYGFIRDPEILRLIETDLESATDVHSDAFFDIVTRCVAIKAEVVSEDFKESGLREILNYGHTLGHAIELTERYSWRHGAAVAVGMVFVAELARMAGRLSDAAAERHRSVLKSLGLPTTYRSDKWDQLLVAMQRDKKSRGGELRFVVLDDVGKPTIMTAPTSEMLFAAYQEICE
jgi:3-dehydroquinate synthase